MARIDSGPWAATSLPRQLPGDAARAIARLVLCMLDSMSSEQRKAAATQFLLTVQQPDIPSLEFETIMNVLKTVK